MERIGTKEELTLRHCKALPSLLDEVGLHDLLGLFSGWKAQNGSIVKIYSFADYHETMTFVEEIAPIIHIEDHHPELIINYNTCEVRFQTDSTKENLPGITENDFICAAKIDRVCENIK